MRIITLMKPLLCCVVYINAEHLSALRDAILFRLFKRSLTERGKEKKNVLTFQYSGVAQ